MARGFPSPRQGADLRYAAKLDEVERGVVIGLMEQVIGLLDAPAAPTGGRGPLDQIVAGMGGLGIGVSVLPEDQQGGHPPGQCQRMPGPSASRTRLCNGASAGNQSDEQVCRVPSADRGRTEAEKGCRAPTVHRGVERRLRVGRGRRRHPSLLAALTDVRLVLGERLEAPDDTDVERLEAIVDTLAPDDPARLCDGRLRLPLTWLPRRPWPVSCCSRSAPGGQG